jgi:hypothetical protein
VWPSARRTTSQLLEESGKHSPVPKWPCPGPRGPADSPSARSQPQTCPCPCPCPCPWSHPYCPRSCGTGPPWTRTPARRSSGRSWSPPSRSDATRNVTETLGHSGGCHSTDQHSNFVNRYKTGNKGESDGCKRSLQPAAEPPKRRGRRPGMLRSRASPPASPARDAPANPYVLCGRRRRGLFEDPDRGAARSATGWRPT